MITTERWEINQQLGVDTALAEALWADGVANGADHDITGINDDNTVRANNGTLLVRRKPLHETNESRLSLTAEDICNTAIRELVRMRREQIDIISYGIVPSQDQKSVFTVTPWLSDLLPCPPTTFDHEVAPKLQSYLQVPAADFNLEDLNVRPQATPHIYMWDISRSAQFSTLQSNHTPFLHDPEPRLSDDATQAYMLARHLSSLQLNVA